MLRRTLTLMLLALLGSALAVDVVVHPFRSQDPALGVAVASRVAEGLAGVAVIGPDIAAMLVPPIPTAGGFLNPLLALRGETFGPTAARLFADGIGVPTVVTGDLRIVETGLELALVVAHQGELALPMLRAPVADLDRLIATAVASIALHTPAEVGALRPLSLRGADAAAMRARTLMGAGFFVEALAAFEGAAGLHPIDEQLRADLASALAEVPSSQPALDAMVALALPDDAAATRAFDRWRASPGAPPVAALWAAVWSVSLGDRDGAEAAFAEARSTPYGRVAAASSAAQGGDPAAVAAALRELRALREAPSATALLAASFVANNLGSLELEDALLADLERLTPFFTYPFERRSFIAFERDDPLGAVRALAVAVELDSESDLYWTNLGWAWYLLGLLDRSEAASRRALELDPGQVIARYNLGLVETVTDRMEAALSSYREALRFDPIVEPEAIVDLEEALILYPDQIGVSFALAFLRERAGERSAAADDYRSYLRRAAASPTGPGVSSALVREAQRREAQLRLPLPPLELGGDPRLTLGRRGPSVSVAQPGDPLALVFEITTAGDSLPRQLEARLRLSGAAGPIDLDAPPVRIDIPEGAIGFVVDTLRFELPVALPAGSYSAEVEAAGGGQQLVFSTPVVVAGEVSFVRQLLGRSLVLTDLERGQPLVAERDLALPLEGPLARMVAELQGAADLAEAALPTVDEGRFAGLSGGAIYAEVDAATVRDFLTHLLASGSRNANLVLVDAFADWVLIGAP